MTSNLTLNLEVTLCCHIEAAAHEAVMVATWIGVRVKFDFNGVDCYVEPASDPNDLIKEWRAAQKSTSENRMAFARTKGHGSPRVAEAGDIYS